MGSGDPPSGVCDRDQGTEDTDHGGGRSALPHDINPHQAGRGKKSQPVIQGRSGILYLMKDQGALCFRHNIVRRIVAADIIIIIIEQIHRTVCRNWNQQEEERQEGTHTSILLQGKDHSEECRIEG